jgi:hypothetical protein
MPARNQGIPVSCGPSTDQGIPVSCGPSTDHGRKSYGPLDWFEKTMTPFSLSIRPSAAAATTA